MDKKKVEELMACSAKAFSEMQIKREKARQVADSVVKQFFSSVKL